MKDEFINETMLDILVDQKRYLEAFRIYKELFKRNMISDTTRYAHLLKEVERIDPVLTMNRELRERKAKRLTRILANIRRLRSERRESQREIDVSDKSTVIEEVVLTAAVTQSTEAKREVNTITTSGGSPDLLRAIEEITRSSVSSIMDIISGNYSFIPAKKAGRIEILQEMLKRIEIIKNQRKKEYINV